MLENYSNRLPVNQLPLPVTTRTPLGLEVLAAQVPVDIPPHNQPEQTSSRNQQTYLISDGGLFS